MQPIAQCVSMSLFFSDYTGIVPHICLVGSCKMCQNDIWRPSTASRCFSSAGNPPWLMGKQATKIRECPLATLNCRGLHALSIAASNHTALTVVAWKTVSFGDTAVADTPKLVIGVAVHPMVILLLMGVFLLNSSDLGVLSMGSWMTHSHVSVATRTCFNWIKEAAEHGHSAIAVVDLGTSNGW